MNKIEEDFETSFWSTLPWVVLIFAVIVIIGVSLEYMENTL